MKIETKNNMIVLKEVHNTILLETEAGKQLYVCMRDGGFEISVDGKNWSMTHKPITSNSINAVEEINNTEDIPVIATPNVEKWDYMGWKEYEDKIQIIQYLTPNSKIQLNWNQTLTTKINQLAYRNPIELDTNVVITVPINLISLIESLEYYNENTHTIGDRYYVEFINTNSNIIIVNNIPLEIENYEQ